MSHTDGDGCSHLLSGGRYALLLIAAQSFWQVPWMGGDGLPQCMGISNGHVGAAHDWCSQPLLCHACQDAWQTELLAGLKTQAG